MMTPPSEGQNEVNCSLTAMDEGGASERQQQWHTFSIRWEEIFLGEHGDKCLPFSDTSHLTLADGTPVNKARNLQELDPDTAAELCHALSNRAQFSSKCKLDKEKCKREKMAKSFFIPSDVANREKTWKELLTKVEMLGTVLLACYFGSRRYNLHTPTSDADMFVVYAANTKDLLGLRNMSPCTIKSKDSDVCDYNVLELSRYCQLLLGADPCCVETLFLHPSSIYMKRSKWEELVQWKSYFLTRQCVNKYVSNAMGSKGIKLLDKLMMSQPVVTLTPKTSKLSYIIIRLLENAREVCQGTLQVYREEGGVDQRLLTDVRSGQMDYGRIRSIMSALLTDTEALKDNIMEKISQTELRELVENWLIKLRYENLKNYMETL